MRKVLSFVIVVPMLCLVPGHAAGTSSPWINELHYDNSGADAGEFVEVAVALGGDLNTITLTLYNGATGAVYGTHSLAGFTPGATVGGYILYYKGITGIQNGSPDGLALDVDGTVVEFISYEGTFTAVDGPAASMTSVDIGVSESGVTTVDSSVGLRGTGCPPDDFVWVFFESSATPGSLNPNQTIGGPSGVEAQSWGSLKARLR